MITCASMQNIELDSQRVGSFDLKNGNPLHVAVGIIKNCEGKILISLRADTVHQGGLWEFPGGKIKEKESVEQALGRELKEELNISILELAPLIKIKHQYDDLEVFLDAWVVTLFSGKPFGLEGQEVKWVCQNQLADYSFPEANYPIINATRLPEQYAILNGSDQAVLFNNLNKMLNDGVKLIQVRLKSLSTGAVRRFFQLVTPLCKEKGVQLLINSAVKNADKFDISGIHLTAQDLLGTKKRPIKYQWVAASCHNKEVLKHAEKIGVDFVVLAPVLATRTHPDVKPLGWGKFEELVATVNLPVYALGGMTKQDIYFSQLAGAQGISGVSAFLL